MANNDISDITMNTDWGAPGTRLTGRQVQRFIKKKLTELDTKLGAHDDGIVDLKGRMDAVEDNLGQTTERVSLHHTAIANVQNRVTALEAASVTVAPSTPAAQPVTYTCPDVLIAYHSKEEHATDGVHSPQCRFASYQQWKQWNDEGENPYTADGVAVFDQNGQPLIIAPEVVRNSLGWDNGSHKSVFLHLTTERITPLQLIQDNHGLARTLAILEEYPTTGLAAQCNSYKRQYMVHHNGMVYVGGFGCGADSNEVSRWWLPSSGECYLMWRYRDQINLCLSEIPGATPIAAGAVYFTSTEVNLMFVACVDFDCGRFITKGKSYVSASEYVSRPVIRPQTAWHTDGMDEPTTL